MDNLSIIYPPGLTWNFMRQRPHQLCIGLAKLGYKVVFNQSFTDIRNQTVFLNKGDYLRDITQEEGIVGNGKLFVCYNPIRYAREFRDEKKILYCSSGPGHEWSDAITPYALIYDELDNFPRWDREAAIACRKADRIVTSSESLISVIDERRERFPEITDKVTYVPNACDFQHWNIARKSLKDFRPPYKIMYIGAFAQWLDHSLILNMVRKFPQCEFWFIGGMFFAPSAKIPIMGLPNVYCISHIEYKQLPFIARDADILWIPFDVSNRYTEMGGPKKYPISHITKHVNPIKFWEYLATGIPIIYPPTYQLVKESSMILPSMETYNLFCAETVGEAADAISYCIDFQNQNKIRANVENNIALANEHTWEKSVKKLDIVIKDVMSADLVAESTVKAEIARTRKKHENERPDLIEVKPGEITNLL